MLVNPRFFFNFMERRLGEGGIKWVITKINFNFSVVIEPKKIELKLRGREENKIEKKLKLE
jgi:hypothetical protein